MDPQLLRELRAEFGELVVDDPDTLQARRFDYWVVKHLRDWRGEPIAEAGAVVQPRSSADVQRLVRFAASHGIAVVPFGLGSGVVGGIEPTPEAIVLDMSRMNTTRSINSTDLLASFDAGKNGAEAEAEVAALGLTIGHWPQSIAVSSVGGWVSTRASGQFSTAYGNIEDVVYSIEAVLPNGELVTLGKAPRAAAGPDLRHVLMGAEGTMGIVTGVTFSLRTAPAHRRFTAFHATDMAQGVEAQRMIVRADWRPPVMRLYDAVEAKRNFAEHAQDSKALLLMVHEGPVGRVEAEMQDVTRIVLNAGLAAGNPLASEEWLAKRNHVPHWSEFFEKGFIVDTVEVSAAWSQINAVYRDAITGLESVPGVVAASAHSSHVYRSGINLYFTFVAVREATELEATYFACWRHVMDATVRNGGGIAHHHGGGRMRKPYLANELGESGVGLLRSIKNAVDPLGIMNPGNLIPES